MPSPLRRSSDVIELDEHTVLPGLIDAHTHLRQVGETLIYSGETPTEGDLALQGCRNLRRDLCSGVTTMRILGEQDFHDVPVRRAVENGTVPGPRLLLATRAIHATNGHGYGAGYDGPDEIRRAVRENLRAGADVIKMMATGSVDLRGGRTSARSTRARRWRPWSRKPIVSASAWQHTRSVLPRSPPASRPASTPSSTAT